MQPSAAKAAPCAVPSASTAGSRIRPRPKFLRRHHQQRRLTKQTRKPHARKPRRLPLSGRRLRRRPELQLRANGLPDRDRLRPRPHRCLRLLPNHPLLAPLSTIGARPKPRLPHRLHRQTPWPKKTSRSPLARYAAHAIVKTMRPPAPMLRHRLSRRLARPTTLPRHPLPTTRPILTMTAMALRNLITVRPSPVGVTR